MEPNPKFCPHCHERLDEDQEIEWAGWHLSETRNMLLFPIEMQLTRNEALFVSALLRAKGNTCRAVYLFNLFYANKPEADWPVDMNNYFKVLVCKLRRKLKSLNLHLVENVWGVGYRALPYTTT